MKFLLLAPMIIQGLFMFVDEFYYHHKRGLPRWERMGHPADTISVLICFLILCLLMILVNPVLHFVFLLTIESID